MTGRVKIAAVSYLNTLPFVYGIQNAQRNSLCAELLLAVPSECARLFKEDKVDVALVPVAALEECGTDFTMLNYCLAADQEVRSVVIFSNSPLKDIKKIYLDIHSRTSRELAKLLCRKKWGITAQFVDIGDYSTIDSNSSKVGYLLIGDKVFNYENIFKFSYDLASEWREHTGFPFVFAVWVAKNTLKKEECQAIENALQEGVESIEKAVSQSSHWSKNYAIEYLTKNIKFNLTEDKRGGMKLFLHELKAESEPSSPNCR